MIARRQFLLVTGACALGSARPLRAQAQAVGKVHRVGILNLGGVSANSPDIAAFLERLGQLGYVEGQNLRLEARSANRQSERLPALAAELARLNMDVIVTITTPAALAAKAATTTIPIVMSGSAAPVALGLVASLARPGGNVTGVTNSPAGFVVKQLQLLKEAAPRISRVAIVMTTFPVERSGLDEMRAAAAALGVTPVSVIIDSPTQPDVAALLTRARADALYVFPNPINRAHSTEILNLAAASRLPAMYGERDEVEKGGLMSYWANWLELRRHAAVYVDKILKGSKPADLPVEDPIKFELVINMKTAKALGLTIPQSLLLRADEVIQ